MSYLNTLSMMDLLIVVSLASWRMEIPASRACRMASSRRSLFHRPTSWTLSQPQTSQSRTMASLSVSRRAPSSSRCSRNGTGDGSLSRLTRHNGIHHPLRGDLIHRIPAGHAERSLSALRCAGKALRHPEDKGPRGAFDGSRSCYTPGFRL